MMLVMGQTNEKRQSNEETFLTEALVGVENTCFSHASLTRSSPTYVRMIITIGLMISKVRSTEY